MTLDSRLDITPLTSPGDAHLDASTENVSAALPSLAGLLDGQPTILDFWAPWCGPCKVLHPMFEAVAATHADTPVRFTRVNVDTHPQLAESFGVMSIPTLVLCDADGDEIERIVGLPEGRRLQELAARAVTLVG